MDIIQGNLLVKKKRKWKSRWVVLRRVNPASERINLYVYKNHLSAISKQKEKLFFPLREYCAIESIDKENRLPKLVIITAAQPLSLRFQNKEERDNWIDTVVAEGNYGEDVPFDVVFPSKQPWRSDDVTLHIYPDFFSLVRKQNCRCVGRWSFEQLFNYGTVEGGFVFRVESESGHAEEPESFLLLTSLEKQINRTFDTVYKTARNMYGSADGLQRSPKVNTSASPRPRSMSEPSGFKRFMHRLSLRRKSRRPKKAKSGPTKQRLDVSSQSPVTRDDTQSISGPVADSVHDKLDSAHQTDGDRRQSENSREILSSTEVSPSSLKADAASNTSDHDNDFQFGSNEVNNKQHVEASERDRKMENGIGKKQECSQDGKSGYNHDVTTENGQHQCGTASLSPTDSEDLTIWQRRSALMNENITEDDMIKKGLMKPKSRERPSSLGDPLTAGMASGYDGKDTTIGGLQGRRNTSGLGGKRPMLTIAIASSGSEPFLNKPDYSSNQTGNVQYVNLPAEPIKNKQIDKLKEGEWSRYDSEENVYHHLAAVVGTPGYENLPDQSLSRSITSLNKSYENVPGMIKDASYENMGAGRGNMHYINVEGAKEKQSVNYIRVAGSGPPTPISKNSGYSFPSRKKDSNYTVIDVEKTQKLLEMTKQTKRPVERAKKT